MLLPNFVLEDSFQFFQSPFGAFIFIVLYALWTSLLLPGSWVSMLAGVLYGTWLGSLLVFLGAFIGAEVVFVLSRSVLRGWVQDRISKYKKIVSIEKAVTKEGIKLILLTRLSPVFPFSLMNFAYGLSEVKFIDYTIGLFGILPGTVFFCTLGELAGDLSKFKEVLRDSQANSSFFLNLISLLSTLAVAFLLTRIASKALQDLDSST